MAETLKTTKKPPLEHLAIIMDGNGRWAKQRELPRIAGHQQGVETVTLVVDECVFHLFRSLPYGIWVRGVLRPLMSECLP